MVTSFVRSTPAGMGCVEVADNTCPEPGTKATNVAGGFGPVTTWFGIVVLGESTAGVTVIVVGIAPPAACVTMVVVVGGGVVVVGAGVVLIGVRVGLSFVGAVL